ncbi:unnamed protein product [Lactuca saligna]|uniref:Uncharacterized protein n=1 Tax=Lactuca saligna TaxID=75948 RepID=A0AA36A2C0_LACSI|nr:unnamed protein product [Lactuca saligna]
MILLHSYNHFPTKNDNQDPKQLQQPHTSHAFALCQVMPNNLNGGPFLTSVLYCAGVSDERQGSDSKSVVEITNGSSEDTKEQILQRIFFVLFCRGYPSHFPKLPLPLQCFFVSVYFVHQVKSMEERNMKPLDSNLASLSARCSKDLELNLAKSFLSEISQCTTAYPYN